MAQGSKASYSSKQKRMARHIEKSEKARGDSTKTAERIAWATVNKETGGAKGKKKASKKAAKKTGKKTSKKTSKKATKKTAKKATKKASKKSSAKK